jgi:hypothetical protein
MLEGEGVAFDDTGSASREAYWKPPPLAERANGKRPVRPIPDVRAEQ